MYLPRGLEGRLERSLATVPLVILEGARATGKTRLIEHVIESGWLSGVRSFLDPAELQAAKAAPRDYVFGLPHGTAIDEAQLCEEILLPVKERIESSKPGALLLTGSTRLRRDELGGSDPLAGRVGRPLHLGPLTLGERGGEPLHLVQQLFDSEPRSISVGTSIARTDLIELVQEPGLPGLFVADSTARSEMARAYIAQATTQSSFASVDVQRVNQLARYLAGRTSTMVNVSEFGKAVELNRSSVDKYLAHLEEALVIVRLPGWRRSKDKSETDRAKVHFFDAGTAAATAQMLPGTQDGDLGRLTETLLVTDLVRQAQWLTEPPSCYHWRRSDRDEVDLVLEWSDGRTVCVEVKVAESVDTTDFRGIDQFREHHPKSFHRGFVFYSGNNVQPFGENRWAIPFGALRPSQRGRDDDPVAAVVAKLAVKRRALDGAGGEPLTKTLVEGEALRQLGVLGDSLEDFDADARLLPSEVVLHVRPVGQRATDVFGEVAGHTGDPMRLITVRVSDDTQEVTGTVQTRHGTWGRNPAREPFDARPPREIVASLLDALVDDLAEELARLGAEFN